MGKLAKLKEGGAAPAAAPAAAAAPPGEKKEEAPKKAKKAPPAKAPERDVEDVTRLNIRVGRINKVWAHEDSDKLFCEEIDLGVSECSLQPCPSELVKQFAHLYSV